jgi:hypothetical protein
MPEPAIVESDFFQVIGTQRAMRRLKPDPVPEEYIKKILWAATRAPSGGNRQGWRWSRSGTTTAGPKRLPPATAPARTSPRRNA